MLESSPKEDGMFRDAKAIREIEAARIFAPTAIEWEDGDGHSFRVLVQEPTAISVGVTHTLYINPDTGLAEIEEID
jgi:hypothetical protein